MGRQKNTVYDAALQYLQYLKQTYPSENKFIVHNFRRLYDEDFSPEHPQFPYPAFTIIGFLKRNKWIFFKNRLLFVKPFRVDAEQKHFSVSESSRATDGEFFVCTICSRGLPNQHGYTAHIKSASHAMKASAYLPHIIEDRAAPHLVYYKCPIPGCREVFDDKSNVESHVLKSRHCRKVQCVQDDMTNGAVAANPYHCVTCGVTCNGPSPFREHTSKKSHLLKVFKAEYRTNRLNLLRDKNGVRISAECRTDSGTCEFKNNVLEITTNRDKMKVQFIIHPPGPEDEDQLKFVSVVGFTYDVYIKFQLSDKLEVSEEKAGENGFFLAGVYLVKLAVQVPTIGNHRIQVNFSFSKLIGGRVQNFDITKEVAINYSEDLALLEELKPEKPYIHKPIKVSPIQNDVVIPGERPVFEKRGGLEISRPLQDYRIPDEIGDILQSLRNGGKRDIGEQLNLSNLEADNYSKYFHNLLYLEEAQQRRDIQQYTLGEGVEDGVPMQQDSRDNLFKLEVPGLAENRPSVLRGDRILVSFKGSGGRTENYKFEGYVHHVELTSVKLGFGKQFRDKFIPRSKFRVEFSVNRLQVKLCHRAVELDQRILTKLLFPPESLTSNVQSQPLHEAPLGRMFNRHLDSNLEQRQAVEKIVCNTSSNAAYLIYGPPGTGKTVTVVETIKQIVDRNPHARILVCAPQNQAADLLTERILEGGPVDKSHIIRLNAVSRTYDSIPTQSVRDVSNYTADTATANESASGLAQLMGHMSVRQRKSRDATRSLTAKKEVYYPSKQELEKFRIVCSTVVTAGRLVSARLVGHFTHIFIDEAGHATEPECLIALAGLVHASTQVVLAGDPEQLGPVIRSPVAVKYGLEKSLLERLMDDGEVYLKDEMNFFNAAFVTKLIQSFRSHPEILKVPNELFYEAELEAKADVAMREKFCEWEGLPRKGFPIIFHGVKGNNDREDRSPSWFNLQEIGVVIKYVKELMDVTGIRPKHIGIISPYRAQVGKISRALLELERRTATRQKNYKDIKVGSVEQFQGEERDIIIISTVRSHSEFFEHDNQFNLGFLNNPKRFNVAITRAKALLIIIGYPDILCADPHWESLIRHIEKNGGVTGSPPPPENDSRIDQVYEMIKHSRLVKGAGVEVEGVSDVTAQVDPPWERRE